MAIFNEIVASLNDPNAQKLFRIKGEGGTGTMSIEIAIYKTYF